jgi:hypothetical protein
MALLTDDKAGFSNATMTFELPDLSMSIVPEMPVFFFVPQRPTIKIEDLPFEEAQ